MKKLLSFPSGRRAKWVVLAVWLIALVGIGAGNLPGKFTDAENNESTSFLPEKAESTKALKATKEIQGSEEVTMVVVYRRDGGLTAQDKAKVLADRKELNALGLADTTPFGAPIPSKDGTEQLLTASIATDGEADTILDPVDAVRERVSDPGGGLQVKVTGSAGYSADAIKVFEGINGTLLLAAVALVFFLLALIYRSPIFLWIPLFSVIAAEVMTRGIGYLLTEAGVTVNGQSSSIMSVLVLGAGTDYALLLVSRYREELRHEEDKHVALATALQTAGPAIIASAVTVVLALLTLSFAEVNGTAGLGPLGALGVLVAMISMLTLLPALLAITGRRAFWPRVPHVGDEGSDVAHGAWRSWGERIARRPNRIGVLSTIALLVMCLGLLNFDTGLTQGNAFRDEVESVQGQKILAKAFPSGANAPTDVVVTDPAKAAAVEGALKQSDVVADVRKVGEGAPGVYYAVTLERDPYSTAAYDDIKTIRADLREVAPGAVLVGGPTAVESDLRAASARDTRLIIPLVLIVVFLVLLVLLRALIAPLLLMGTVVLSFAAALGVSAVVFDVIFGFPGSDVSLPLFAFVFLVALGIDYNIFLMTRVREETERFGTEHGMLRGLAVTGGVITAAGIVLAGTFTVLGVLPLVFLTQLGFVVAFGVLLDTFLVRSTLVPAAVLAIGSRVWWPSRLAHEGEPGGPQPEDEPLDEEQRPGDPAPAPAG